MTELGANKQFKLLGRPEQPSATVLSSEPDWGVTLIVTLPDPPGVRVIVGALTLSVNPGLPVAQ